MNSLQKGEDVLAVLPTGFGESMIFTVFGIAKRESSRLSCVLLICALKSVLSDQIAKLETLCTAVELTAENVSRVLEEPAEFIYSSAEQVLEEYV